MKRAQKHRNPTLPKQYAEWARLKVVKGPDVGCVYVITGSPASIGRGEENDVQLQDLKASRLHADLRGENGVWQVADLGSANGVQHNGQQAREFRVKDGDLIGIGETILEFVTTSAWTMVLAAPARSMEMVQQDRAAVIQQEERLKFLTTPGALSAAGAQAVSAGRKNLPLIVVGLAIVALLMMEDKKTPVLQKNRKTDGLTRDLASFLPSSTSQEARKSADVFYKVGFREFRERNYLRAKSSFETALQVDPSHRLAKLYLENCEYEIKEEVAFHMNQGNKLLQSGRFRESKSHFEAVRRLLLRDQSQNSFIEAGVQLEEIRKKIKGDET